ncbi:PREDICTED: transmembrane protein 249 [Thamnophis sirtalis]|uniref:Transmembrane protein 249 n=1 Tax=Thamnophis sirtalis TaxID=35019 RepID=A0A6I9X236_9SAUR|nr:PREDICTED: transmembrane protein 249 [Thamnophis sirtalis]
MSPVFVMEYYKDTVWKGLLGFVISLIASIFYFKTTWGYQDLSAFVIFALVASLWVLLSNLCKRRLIINHLRELYQFYIRGILWHEGPLHQIYVRLVGQRDGNPPPPPRGPGVSYPSPRPLATMEAKISVAK